MGLEQQIVLRTARMGGFVKEDVLAYVDELNSKIYALEEEKSALQKKLETGGMSDKEKTSYEEELARLRGELGTTKNQLRAAQDELKKRPVIDGSGEGGASAEELEAVQAELADARTKIESMSSELTDTQAELNAAKAEIEMAQENAAEQAKKIEDLNADNEQLRQDLSQAVAQSLMGGADDDAKATLSAELVDLQQKNAELQAKLNDTAEEAASLKAELEAKDSMFAEQANLSNESDLKRLAEYEAQIADLQHSLAEKQQEIDAQAQQIVELQENSTDIGSGMSALFLEAQQTTNRLKAEAKKDAEKRVKEATEQAEAIVAEATAKADEMIANATAQSEQTVANANAQAETTITGANAQAEATIANANAEAEQKLNDADAKAIKIVADAEDSVRQSLVDAERRTKTTTDTARTVRALLRSEIDNVAKKFNELTLVLENLTEQTGSRLTEAKGVISEARSTITENEELPSFESFDELVAKSFGKVNTTASIGDDHGDKKDVTFDDIAKASSEAGSWN